jgi:hypothetical protein
MAARRMWRIGAFTRIPATFSILLTGCCLVTNVTDHHLYDWWISSSNTLSGIDLGPYWANVSVVTAGQFTNNGGTNLLVSNNIDHHLYDWWIGSNNQLQGIDLGPYWSNVAIVANGQFTTNGGTNFLVTNIIDHHLYDWWINGSTLQGFDLGAYWSGVQLVTVGRFDNHTTNTEILVQNPADHHLYEWWISGTGQLTGIDLGAYWANVQLIGNSHYNNNSTFNELLVRNTVDGHFYEWWISGNQLTGVDLGAVPGGAAGAAAGDIAAANLIPLVAGAAPINAGAPLTRIVPGPVSNAGELVARIVRFDLAAGAVDGVVRGERYSREPDWGDPPRRGRTTVGDRHAQRSASGSRIESTGPNPGRPGNPFG